MTINRAGSCLLGALVMLVVAGCSMKFDPIGTLEPSKKMRSGVSSKPMPVVKRPSVQQTVRRQAAKPYVSGQGYGYSRRTGVPYATVVPGDTLFSIARQNGTTVSRLMTLNRLQSYSIAPGQRLRLR